MGRGIIFILITDVWTVSSSGDETGSREDWDMVAADASSLAP